MSVMNRRNSLPPLHEMTTVQVPRPYSVSGADGKWRHSGGGGDRRERNSGGGKNRPRAAENGSAGSSEGAGMPVRA